MFGFVVVKILRLSSKYNMGSEDIACTVGDSIITVITHIIVSKVESSVKVIEYNL